MTDESDAIQSSIVAAVQLELARYNEMVSAELQRLRDEVTAERAARARTDEQVLALLPAVERSQATTSAFQTEIHRALDIRLTEFAIASKRRQEEVETRIGRIVDEINLGLTATVESAAQPIVKELEDRQVRLETELAAFDLTVRKFDGQAAKIVEHINVITEATESRIDEVSEQVTEEIDGRIAALATRLDEVSAQAARQQAEVANVVGSRVEQAESRINERLVNTEGRINETVGQRIADIDAYVGRVSASLDDAVSLLSDRLAGADARFDEVNLNLDAIAVRLDAVDVDALDELKDRVGGLAGQVELIRIETERFQESMGQTMDRAVVRIVEVETQLQEQHLDVETAVQLERLEEVERALIALDPNQFVRRSDVSPTPSGSVDLDGSGGNSNDVDEAVQRALAAMGSVSERSVVTSPVMSSPKMDGSPSASTPMSPPTTFNSPVNAQH